MQLTVTILLVITLGLIAYQDFKTRTILWILFPIGMALSMGNGLLEMNARNYFSSTIINLVLVLLMLLVTFVYFAMKKVSLPEFLERYIGPGDVLIFCLLGFCFSTVNLLLFVISVLFATLVAMGVLLLMEIKVRNIPLAGILSVVAAIVLISDLAGITNILSGDVPGIQIVSVIIRMP